MVVSIEQAPAISCMIEAQRVGGSLRLRGAILSLQQASGSYRLEIVKESGGGASNIRQSGDFTASVNLPTLVGSTTVDFAPGARIKALLTVNAADRSYQCSFDNEAQ
ncbi:hypothetical protein M2322_004333 [Rhodoblastus acidophilus]|uniref:curli-like amyloid fiber formation chaperone CsgH n=1 Tax=Rhodoblastus acidophilus TaxID=1074 RepID=UPI0022258E01|nr:curli-like amyloid fiber formation chaperone CsgH [Rhodoblastus acidophilus]MCW2318764.1 hypothetical protein [Rhodoblastus acidophilus]